MTDEEFRELKKKVEEEEQRRSFIKDIENRLEKLSNNLGLKTSDGWTRNLKTTVHQTWVQLSGADGNGPESNEEKTTEISEQDMEILGVIINVFKRRIKKVIKESKEKNLSRSEMWQLLYNIDDWFKE